MVSSRWAKSLQAVKRTDIRTTSKKKNLRTFDLAPELLEELSYMTGDSGALPAIMEPGALSKVETR